MTADEASGLVLLNKKSGYTSFESLGPIKKALSTGKVGHTGTLDKFASGLLVVLAGRAVKLIPWFLECDKWYEGSIRFGMETDTLDPGGKPVAQGPLPSREALEAVLNRFRGDILQAPPAYSRLHVQGERAYRLARSGTPLVMEQRPVSVYALELLSYEPPLACIRVHCSKGTYIRSLARDIALAAGSRGHLSALRRTAIAGFSLDEALDFSGEQALPAGALRPIDQGVFRALGIPVYVVEGAAALGMIRGKPLDTLLPQGWSAGIGGQNPFSPGAPDPDTVGIFRSDGAFVALVRKAPGTAAPWSYGYVYARA
jgi:tRNA pseudouridine55 synthase